MTKTQAREGELVALAVDAAGGDGFAVKLVVTSAAGAELTQLEAPIEGGVARASWVVDLKGAQPPVDVTFTAHLADQTVEAAQLAVVRGLVLGPVALVAIAVDDSVARGAIGPVRAGHPPAPTMPPVPALGSVGPRDSYALVLDLSDGRGGAITHPCNLDAILDEAPPGEDFVARQIFELAIREVPGHQYHVVLRVPAGSSGPDATRYRMRLRGAKQQPTAALAVDPAEYTTGTI